MSDCIFCKIIAGEIPADKVFENEMVFAFLDASPKSRGHTLIVPKKHFENIFDIDEKYLEAIIRASKEISILAKERLGAEGINTINNSGVVAHQSVLHYHMHVIPRYKDDELNTWPDSPYKETDFKEVVQKLAK
jgi:histidine triad (HIT) family protein